MTKIGILGVAHLHADSYVHCLRARDDSALVGVFDRQADRAMAFAHKHGSVAFDSAEALLNQADVVIVCSENLFHGQDVCMAAPKPVLCEKPLAAGQEDFALLESHIASGAFVATAFPCPFSPTFGRLAARIQGGEIGEILAVNATNRGKCPFGWFTDPALSGGGAAIDHVVHVADLLFRLLGEEPVSVRAHKGHNMYGEIWEDTAKLLLDYPSGVFATIDSSWSRHQNYKIWGDVTLTVTGSEGVLEADLFGQGLAVTGQKTWHSSTGSNLDALLLDDFLSSVRDKREPRSTGLDGLRASRVALDAYKAIQAAP
ncbi:MAG: Gfo/Idh/MocA family oxidoreductase [Chthonomonadaceae bacterium]|nr:Gfo/Idh/MocA family oxidoreductase [Chthonomonadaceae bacterium]